MNQEDIMKALEICSKDGGRECTDCPFTVVPYCRSKLILEARNLILSMLEKQAEDARVSEWGLNMDGVDPHE